MNWRDAAALWGAGLSTFLALASLLPSRPRFHVEPGEPPGIDLLIRVVNPAKRMCFVRELWRVQLGGPDRSLGVYTVKTPSAEVGVPGSLWISIESEDETRVVVNCIDGRTGFENCWLIVFGWQGPWLLPVWVPVPVLVSTARARRLNAAR